MDLDDVIDEEYMERHPTTTVGLLMRALELASSGNVYIGSGGYPEELLSDLRVDLACAIMANRLPDTSTQSRSKATEGP